MYRQRSSSKLTSDSPLPSKPTTFSRSELDPILQMQAMLGNQMMNRVITAPRVGGNAIAPIQAKPRPQTKPLLQTKPLFKGLSQDLVEAESPQPVAGPLPSSNGKPLPAKVQDKMAAAFGTDFSTVRIHEGSAASAIGAIAYTQGTDIHFAAGHYHPTSHGGQTLLGHELAHVVQQQQGIVKPTFSANGLSINNDPSLEQQADRMGQAAANAISQGPVSATHPGSSPPGTSPLMATRPRRDGSVIQCVGGIKFGIKPNEELKDLRTTAAYLELQKIVNTYKQEVQAKKKKAFEDFNASQDNLENPQKQDEYAQKLFEAEMTIDQLRQKIGNSTVIKMGQNNKVLDKKGTLIAELLSGNEAYALTKAAGTTSAETGQVQNIYKKYRLEGLDSSDTEYIESNNRKVRRFANRGITPPEKAQIRSGNDVKPVYFSEADRKKNQTGVHYPENADPYKRASTKQIEDGTVANGDLDFLYYAGVKEDLKEVPLESRPFLQERKGVNKEFSATATGKAITSNHGASFGTFGSVTIDLAKVDPTDILHHYANVGEMRMSSGVPKELISDKWKMQQEETRAGKTAIRNREVHLNKYPASAVVGGIQDSPGVKAYKDAYDIAYRANYIATFDTNYDFAYRQASKLNPGQEGASYVTKANRAALYNLNTLRFNYRDNGTGQATGQQHGLEDSNRNSLQAVQAGAAKGQEHGSQDVKLTKSQKKNAKKKGKNDFFD